MCGIDLRVPLTAQRWRRERHGAVNRSGVAGMTKEMIISSSAHETRVAILEDDQVAEIFIERERSRGVVGNLVQGPGIQSAARHAVGVR